MARQVGRIHSDLGELYPTFHLGGAADTISTHPRSQPLNPSLASPLCYLQVTCGKVLLHVLLEGFLKKLLPLPQLHLLGMLHLQDLPGVLCI